MIDSSEKRNGWLSNFKVSTLLTGTVILPLFDVAVFPELACEVHECNQL